MDTGPEVIVLRQIERRGTLYRLHFSNDAVFRATPATVQLHALTEGKSFPPEAFAELIGRLEQEFARHQAMSLLAQRPYSIGEFKRRLRHKGVAAGLISDLVSDFKSQGLLGDYDYALFYTRMLLLRRPAGKAYMIADLQRRQVPRLIAEKAVAEVLSEVDETDIALRLLEKRVSALSKFDLETARRKAYTYLARRGIPYGAAKKAFEKLFDKT